MWTQETYLAALAFAAEAHKEQRVPGNGYPYVVHLCQVAMEIMALPEAGDLALSCALLHDTIEDTAVTFDDLSDRFGLPIAEGVLALTKNSELPKEQRMADSLQRIRRQPKDVWLVKIADRITNLQKPPESWSQAKRLAYLDEARTILEALGEAHAGLRARFSDKIANYAQWC